MFKRALLLAGSVMLAPFAAHSDPLFVDGAIQPCCTLVVKPGIVAQFSTGGYDATARYQGDRGAGSFGLMSFVTQPLVVNNFTFPIEPTASESFSYVASAVDQNNAGPVDSLMGQIAWEALSVENQVRLKGMMSITQSQGDAAFETDFPLGGALDVEAFFPSQCMQSDDVADCFVQVQMVLDAAAAAVPEPASSLALVVIAVVGLFMSTRGRAAKLGLPPERAT